MKLKEFAGDQYYLDGEGTLPLPTVSVSEGAEGELMAFVDWIEPLEWHVETWQNLMKALGFDRDDWRLTSTMCDAISNTFAEDGVLNVGVGDGSDMLGDTEHGALLFCITLPAEALEMDVDSEELHGLLWDFLASCHNLTDPGTFGHVYLFAEVARKLGIEWTDEVHEAGEIRGVLV